MTWDLDIALNRKNPFIKDETKVTEAEPTSYIAGLAGSTQLNIAGFRVEDHRPGDVAYELAVFAIKNGIDIFPTRGIVTENGYHAFHFGRSAGLREPLGEEI